MTRVDRVERVHMDDLREELRYALREVSGDYSEDIGGAC